MPFLENEIREENVATKVVVNYAYLHAEEKVRA